MLLPAARDFRCPDSCGVGSTIGAHFMMADASCRLRPSLRSVRHHRAGADRKRWRPRSNPLVDILAASPEGRLIRGDNPVLMTMELVLEVL